ncbi:MAG TPA: outer membrane beta-barrel protein [Verrucomicrobiae bacterium]|nr:outer membrane beta-barrel protein [Verrucomicrobiae bacterium]
MKFNRWTLGLAAAGVVSLASATQAEEAKQNVMTALSSTTISGYVDTSAIWKFGTGNGLVGRSFDGTAKQDGFNLNVVKLSIEKPLEEGDWAAGYKADLLFGPDAIGYNTSAGAAAGDFGIKQAYVELRAPIGNGLDIKMGVFDTIIGYEVYDSVNNPNYSRSYGYFIEPTEHTGLLLSYKWADWLNTSVGVANTWNAGINSRAAGRSESEKTYMASVTLTAPDSWGALKGSSLYLGAINGINNANTTSDTTSLYAGVSVPTPLEHLSLGASADYRMTEQKGKVSGGNAYLGGNDSTYANAYALYLSYQVTEKLKISTRGEYASGTDGTWYFDGFGASPNNNPHNELFGATVTVDYSLWANVVTRAEVRWDSALAGGDNNSAKPFGLGVNPDKNALSLALNVIYKF